MEGGGGVTWENLERQRQQTAKRVAKEPLLLGQRDAVNNRWENAVVAVVRGAWLLF